MEKIQLPDSDISLGELADLQKQSNLKEELIESLIFRKDKIKMFGKTYEQPRLVAFYSDEGVCYKYSGIDMVGETWSPKILELKKLIQSKTGHFFNSVLINVYRNGQDYMSFHSDDERELGPNPCIASLSIGAERDFLFKHKTSNEKHRIRLKDSSLLLMKGKTQRYWKHSIPKRIRVAESRINLTFRTIYPTLR